MILAGMALLVKGADWIIDGASELAKKFNVSPLVIGMTVVAFGTSFPEFVVNIFSALNGSTDLALGNIVGSNIANILLILGVIAFLRPPKVSQSTIWKEIPMSLLAAVILFMAANDLLIDGVMPSSITRIDGLVMLAFFAIFIYYSYGMAKRGKLEGITPKRCCFSTQKISLLIFGGLTAIYFGGVWTVENAVLIAQNLGISEFLISATIIAIGTSLPELVTGVIAAMKKHTDIGIGTVVGSNIFNIFFVLASTAVISPIALPAFANFDLIWLIFINILLFTFVFLERHRTLERTEAITFIFLYLVYIFIVIGRG